MTTARFSLTTKIAAPRDLLYKWHCAPAALPRLSPPWKNVQVITCASAIEDGARAVVRVPLGPFPFEMEAEHYEVIPGKQFRDRQIKGPFKYWDHLHLFEDAENKEGYSHLTDKLEFEAPVCSLGNTIAEKDIARIFRYRHEVTRLDIERLHTTQRQQQKVLISGASGLIGTVVSAMLENDGHEVWNLTRRPKGKRDIRWNPDRGELDLTKSPDFDAVIHLAGESVDGTWTSAKKERILQSRDLGTKTLIDALLAKENKPSVFISASGINIYPEGTEEPADEEHSTTEKGFLAGVCHRWEAASAPLERAGIRRVLMRTGMVLSPQGGGLSKMLPIFKTGLGGTIGSGKQRMSWIALDDIAEIYFRAVFDPKYQGVINAVAPDPISNTVFTDILGKVLNRPTLLNVPEAIVKNVFGEMGKSTILADIAVKPSKLLQLGYKFRYKHLNNALKFLLGKT